MEETKNGCLTPADIAEKLEVSIDVIRKACQSGKLPAIKAGRKWLIQASDAREFMAIYRQLTNPRGLANPSHPLYGIGRQPDPNSLASKGEYTHIFLPCSPEHAAWLTGLLKPAERLAILDEAARQKEAKNGT